MRSLKSGLLKALHLFKHITWHVLGDGQMFMESDWSVQISVGDIKKSFLSTDGPWFNDGSTYNFSTLPWSESNMYLAATALWILDVNLSRVSSMWYDTLPCAGQRQPARAPSRWLDHKGKQPIHLQPFCTHTTIWLFSFSAVFNKLHDLLNIIL